MTKKYKLTTLEIEYLLGTEEYKPLQLQTKRDLKPEQAKEWAAVENVRSFGSANIMLFDELLAAKGTLPTQQEYITDSVDRMAAYIAENHPEINVTAAGLAAMAHRSARTYNSNVTELHLIAMLQEEKPKAKIITDPLIDSILGVDIILEDGGKRQYIHVTTDSRTAHRMLQQKESRGGTVYKGSFIKYNRDFTGDLILKYSSNKPTKSTEIINGYPLFRQKYILQQLYSARKDSKIGEPLTLKRSLTKLSKFKQWLSTELNTHIKAGA